MPRVSVIIPTYNRVNVLTRAIDSVLDQTVTDLEIIVVDDGSTDDTLSVLNSYQDPRVRHIAHDTNRGANIARNTGIEAAKGEYVAFLDSDDEWQSEKLERQLGRLVSKPDEYVAAYCGFEIRTPGTTGRVAMLGAAVLSRRDPQYVTEGGEKLMGEILADNVHPGAGSTLMVETSVAQEIGGFDETLDRFQDPEIVLRILEVGKVACVDEPLVIRYDTGSPSAEQVKSADEQYLATYHDRVEQLESEGYDIRGSHNLILAKYFFAEGAFLSGFRHFRDASVSRRQYPGVLWAFGGGMKRRPRSAAIIVLGALLLLSVSWIAIFS